MILAMQNYWIAALVFGILVALFAVQNSQPITIGFLWLSMQDVAVSVVIVVSAALGALITGLFGLGREIRHRMRVRSGRRAVRDREKQIAELLQTIERVSRERAELQAKLEVYERAPANAQAVPLMDVKDVPPETLAAADSPRSALGAGTPAGEKDEPRRAG